MTDNLTFYTGSQCSLCDLAKGLLAQVAPELIPGLTIIDVKAERAYFHAYGARIPVLQRGDNQAELGWPFTAEQLAEFLK